MVGCVECGSERAAAAAAARPIVHQGLQPVGRLEDGSSTAGPEGGHYHPALGGTQGEQVRRADQRLGRGRRAVSFGMPQREEQRPGEHKGSPGRRPRPANLRRGRHQHELKYRKAAAPRSGTLLFPAHEQQAVTEAVVVGGSSTPNV